MYGHICVHACRAITEEHLVLQALEWFRHNLLGQSWDLATQRVPTRDVYGFDNGVMGLTK